MPNQALYLAKILFPPLNRSVAAGRVPSATFNEFLSVFANIAEWQHVPKIMNIFFKMEELLIDLQNILLGIHAVFLFSQREENQA